MNVNDKIFITLMNLALMVFLYFLYIANRFQDSSKDSLIFIVPMLLLPSIIAMIIKKYNSNKNL